MLNLLFVGVTGVDELLELLELLDLVEDQSSSSLAREYWPNFDIRAELMILSEKPLNSRLKGTVMLSTTRSSIVSFSAKYEKLDLFKRSSLISGLPPKRISRKIRAWSKALLWYSFLL